MEHHLSGTNLGASLNHLNSVARTKDMVNVSESKVYTHTVDEVLYQHPSGLMAAAFGVPDPEIPGSECVIAIIQLKSEYRYQTSEDEIRDFCREHLSFKAKHKYIEFRKEMPLTVSEKVFKTRKG